MHANCFFFSVPSFSGCVANFSLNNMEVDFSVSEIAERVEVSNCPSSVSLLLVSCKL